MRDYGWTVCAAFVTAAACNLILLAEPPAFVSGAVRGAEVEPVRQQQSQIQFIVVEPKDEADLHDKRVRDVLAARGLLKE